MTKLNFEVIQAVNIPTQTEDYLSALVRKDVESQLPKGFVVDKIEFSKKLSPTRIEVDITTKYVGDEPAKETTEEPEPTNKVGFERNEEGTLEPVEKVEETQTESDQDAFCDFVDDDDNGAFDVTEPLDDAGKVEVDDDQSVSGDFDGFDD